MLQKIKEIREYKSFRYYDNDLLEWMKDANFSDKKFSLFFAENWCWKSSICDILKSLYWISDFKKDIPKYVSLDIENVNVVYENWGWLSKPSVFSKENILFFDTDFINKNVHKWKVRSTTKGEQEQSSGKLLVDFDSIAIEKKNKYEDYQRLYKDIQRIQSAQQNKYSEKLTSILTNSRILSFYKNHTREDIDDIKTSKTLSLEDYKKRVQSFEKTIPKLQLIQKEVTHIATLPDWCSYALPDKTKVEELFNKKIPENPFNDELKKELANKIKSNRDFFQNGKTILHNHQDTTSCPYCQRLYNDDTINNIIKLTNDIFWWQREKFEREFCLNIDETIKKLDKFIWAKKWFTDKLDETVNALSILWDKYTISNIKINNSASIYQELNSINTNVFSNFIEDLIKLKDFKKHIFRENIFKALDDEAQKFNSLLDRLKDIIDNKNIIITDYLKKFCNKEVADEGLRSLKYSISLLEEEIKYLDYKLIKSEYERQDLDNFITGFYSKYISEYKTKYQEYYWEYKAYCNNAVFEKTIKGMNSYIEDFNLDLILVPQVKNRVTDSFPFSYHIQDSHKNIRTMEDGLSEWERQILSLSFFFSWIDNQEELWDKILIFDDPITSMDSWNLHKLSKIISNKWKKFKQVIIFTHHSLFYKYLSEKFKYYLICSDKGDINYWKPKDACRCLRFGILKNKYNLGGSFLYYQYPNNNINILREVISDEKNFIIWNQDYQTNVVRFGQILRYEVENYIKNDILQWNSDKNFSLIISNLTKVVKKNDRKELWLSKIRDLYEYCNWSNTNHNWMEEVTSWNELRSKIEKFIQVYDWVNFDND